MNRRKELRLRLFFEGVTVGILTGLVIAALRFILDTADIYRPIWFSSFTAEKIFLTVGIFILIAWFLNKAIKSDGQIAGSGVPQLEGILQGKMKMKNPLRLLVVKFFASILAIGSGMSLGRAGISVQFGACIGNYLTKFFHNRKFFVDKNFLLIAGSGAGLAAIFSAPLAGVVFCTEELSKKITSEILVVSMTAAISASSVVQIIFGIRPVFETILQVTRTNFSPNLLLHVIVLGIVAGIVGAIFTKSLIFSLDFYDKQKIFGVKRFLIPMILIILIGPNLPEILGCGNVLVDDLLNQHFTLGLLIILFFAKFLFTMICFGTGTPGGIFLPLLVVGALVGGIFAKVGIMAGIFSAEWTTLFIIFGMAANFAAVVKAPVTGSILIFELTGNFSYLLGLLVVSGVAFLISDLCGGEPAYSTLLQRSLSKKSGVRN